MEPRETINIGREPRQFRSFATGTVWLAAALVIVLAAILGALLALPQRPTPLASSIQEITAHGTLKLDDPGAGFETVGGAGAGYGCAGSGMFADARPGAEMTVTAGGSILRTGKINYSLAYRGICDFGWTVEHVPVGYDVYRIAMAGRGTADVTCPYGLCQAVAGRGW